MNGKPRKIASASNTRKAARMPVSTQRCLRDFGVDGEPHCGGADAGHFTVEILGYQTLDEALSLAQHYAALWDSTVHLYRVPFINTSATRWADDEMQFECRVTAPPQRNHL